MHTTTPEEDRAEIIATRDVQLHSVAPMQSRVWAVLVVALLCADADGLVVGGLVKAPMRAACTQHRHGHVECMGIRTRLRKIFGRKGKVAAAEAKVAVAPPPLAAPAPKPPPAAPIPTPEPIAKAEPKKEEVVEVASQSNENTALATSVSEGIAPLQDAVSSALEPIWTLEDRDDGFNDVRKAIKDRQKPWEELKASLEKAGKAPAVRWAKVLVDEAKELTSKK